ncbi:bifunctional phosphatase PAP2/diacylglycerol kinase family protein [Streptomyces sp. NBC_00239]|uniref:bifunctional phosphatase PAP2/diacylglycerol kinase family protein n=1 Tax=Streptomyces sp. NBC_00239 TaxID=2903640 RepID=UPI002E2ACB54|nr:phosphatase PAP2 family protein [Streptomyces sp. NBC_00239]
MPAEFRFHPLKAGAAARQATVTWQGALARVDRELFDAVARRHWPGADRVLPRLGRAADHGVLWAGLAAALAVGGSARTRRAAGAGLASLALASATVNTVGKWSVRRPRPVIDAVPPIRQLRRAPLTTSFPSGHAASAFAFAAGVASLAPAWGVLLGPVAASVAFSRVYTGVHYPADVAAGAALGVTAGLVVRPLNAAAATAAAARIRTVPGGPAQADGAPALPDGAGLVLVANSQSGTANTAGDVLAGLPRAELVTCTGPELTDTLASAAARCTVLGVCGGDGTVNAAATAALRAGVPLAVFPGGTLNHFAQDLGILDAMDTVRALTAGEAVRVGVGRFTPGPEPVRPPGPDGGPEGGPGDGPGRASEPGYFLNTFSIGVYPELLGHRLRWAPRIGGGPAALLAAWRVLRTERPVRLRLAGRPRPVWLLFAGNGTYHGTGPTPKRRLGLGEELLDVRVVRGGGRPGPRLFAAAMAGPLTRSPVHLATRVRSLRISDVPPGTPLAYDGEYATAPTEFRLDKLPEALLVYRPATTP